MTYAPPEENTLGVILGRGKRREADATRRVIRAATPHRSSLGTGFIGIGAAIVCGLRAIYGLSWFAGQAVAGICGQVHLAEQLAHPRPRGGSSSSRAAMAAPS